MPPQEEFRIPQSKKRDNTSKMEQSITKSDHPPKPATTSVAFGKGTNMKKRQTWSDRASNQSKSPQKRTPKKDEVLAKKLEMAI